MMMRTFWIFALSSVAAAATSAVLTSPPMAASPSSAAPYVIIKNNVDSTEISMLAPDTLGASRTQRLSKDLTYNNTCTLDKSGNPIIEKTTAAYPRIAATLTRVSSEELLVEWKTRRLEKLTTYTVEACTIEAPVWDVKEHSRKIILSETSIQIDGWTLELRTQLPGIGATP